MNDVAIKYETGDDTKVINVDIDDLILQLNSKSKFCILDEIIINKDKKHKIIVCENYIYCISKEELEYERY